jgi:hypothetical protein
VTVQQPGRLGDAGVGPDGDGRAGHHLDRGGAGRLGPGLAPPAALEQLAFRRPLGELLLEHQVGLGDDPDHAPAGVDHRQGADLGVGHHFDELLERRLLTDGDDVLGHDISYVPSHGNLLPARGRV